MAIERVNDIYGLQSLIREFNSGQRDSSKLKADRIDPTKAISGDMAKVSNPIADSVKSSRSLPGVQSAAPIREMIDQNVEQKVKPNFIKQLNEYGDQAPRELAQHSKGVINSTERASVNQYGGQAKQPLDSSNKLVTVLKTSEENMFAPRMKVTNSTVLQPEKVSDSIGALFTPQTNRISDGANTVKGERTVEASMGRKQANISGQESIISTANTSTTYLDSVKKAEELKNRDKAPMGFDALRERAQDNKITKEDRIIARQVREGELISANPSQTKDAEMVVQNIQDTRIKNNKSLNKSVLSNLTELTPLEQDLKFHEKVELKHSAEPQPNLKGALDYPEANPSILGVVAQDLERKASMPSDAAKTLPEVGFKEVDSVKDPIYRNLPTPGMLVESQFPVNNIDKSSTKENLAEVINGTNSKGSKEIDTLGQPVFTAIEKEYQKEIQQKMEAVKDKKSIFSKAASEVVNQRISTSNERLTISALASNVLGPGK